MNHLVLPLLFATLLLGCSGDGGREPATAPLAALQAEVTALQTDLSTHAAAIAAAPDLASMMMSEAAHAGDAHTRMGSMGQDVDLMGMCSDAQGAMMGTGSMGMMVDQAMSECDRHAAAMGQAADMSAAMAEETAHQSAMAALMGQLTSAHDQMMAGGMMAGGMTAGGMMGNAGAYTCPMMSQP
jgi:hypothetical protein